MTRGDDLIYDVRPEIKGRMDDRPADRSNISADGQDLSFITVRITDKNGLTVLHADNLVKFSIAGPGETAATDNGDPTDMVPFPSHEREAFNGLAVAIVRAI